MNDAEETYNGLNADWEEAEAERVAEETRMEAEWA